MWKKVKNRCVCPHDSNNDDVVVVMKYVWVVRRSRLLSDVESVDGNKVECDENMIGWKWKRNFVLQESSTLTDQRSLFLRLLFMSRPEWAMILIGCLICALTGASQTMFAILIAKIINVSIWLLVQDRWIYSLFSRRSTTVHHCKHVVMYCFLVSSSCCWVFWY